MTFPGGRRFSLAVFVFVTCVVLLWFGKLSDSSFRDITIATVAVLIAGHTYQAVKAKPSE